MRKVFLTLWTLMCAITLCAQETATEVRSLVIKTTDNNLIKVNLADIEEISFVSEPAGTEIPVTVTRLLNLTPNFFTVVGLEENHTLTSGTEAFLTLQAGEVLNGTFQDYHFQHIHIQVNDEVIVPEVPEDYVPTSKLKISFKVPSEDCDIVVCYSVQQQMIETGYTMTLEENPNVTMFGVSPVLHYKYFDAYLLTDDAFVITNAQFKMGNGSWQDVNGTIGCSLIPNDYVANLYNITIRPDYQNVTGDVLVRVEGEQHHRYSINWVNADAKYLDLEMSTLPSEAIDGQSVTAELYINEEYYLKGASASTLNTEVKVLYGAYVCFTMPDDNTTITLDIEKKIPVALSESEHVATAEIYNAPDIYYGVPITMAAPGENIYIIASAEEGFKPMTATADDGSTYPFHHYGLDMYLCSVLVPEDATSLTASISCAQAWTVSSKEVIQCNDGDLYAEGETVTFGIQVPYGKKIESVKAITATGKDLIVTLDAPYASFVMPSEDVNVTVTFSDIEAGNTVSVIAYYDDDQYRVMSPTNYDWDFAEGFQMDKDATFYLNVFDFYGENFFVGIKIGDTVQIYPATEDEESGEYTFGKALVATGDITIKVGPTEASVSFGEIDTPTPTPNTVSVIAYYDEDQYRVSSSTNYDWNFAEGFQMDKDTSFYLSVVDDYGENFYVGVKIGDEVQIYPATEDEDTGEYTFGKSFTATGDITIKVGPTEASVSFSDIDTPTPTPNTVSVIAYFDEDQYRVSSSTNYDWNFAEGFQMDKDTSFYLSVVDDYGENFYVGVKIGDEVQIYPAIEDEDTGEYTFGKSFTATADITIKVGPTESSVNF